MIPTSTSSPDSARSHFFVVLHLQIVELLFEAADDLADLVRIGEGSISIRVVNSGQLA